MSAFRYRPWGLLPWVIHKCPDLRWGFIGSFWTEERGLSAWRTLNGLGKLSSTYFANIVEPPSRFTLESDEILAKRKKEYEGYGGSLSDIYDHLLFDRVGDIVNTMDRIIDNAGPNIVLDISSLPKRFFFPFVKLLIKATSIDNLIVVYTLPRAHTDNLAENYQDWNTLPLFQGVYPDLPTKMLIVSVGYLAMGLSDQIEQDNPHLALKILFPFPPGPPSFQKTLELVRLIKKNLKTDRLELIRVNAVDTPDAYDLILAHTQQGELAANFAPFGPKPISLAMAIYAAANDRPVFYNQPKTYHPKYSIGVSDINGIPETYAYCIRINGHDFYDTQVSGREGVGPVI